MFFSIIINTHNQHETINRCLKSCLNQNFKKKYEIIVIDTSDKKIDKKQINSSKIKYYHFQNFSKYPEINQLKKVYKGFKKAKGKWFCLMDGDDYFKRNKLSSIYKKYNLKKNFLLQDDYINLNEYTHIITWSQFHSVHLVGLELKKLKKINWVTYFSDPWSDNPFQKSFLGLEKTFNLALERKVITNSDQIIYTSEETRKLVNKKYDEKIFHKS